MYQCWVWLLISLAIRGFGLYRGVVAIEIRWVSRAVLLFREVNKFLMKPDVSRYVNSVCKANIYAGAAKANVLRWWCRTAGMMRRGHPLRF